MAIYDVTDLNVYNRALYNLPLVYRLARRIPKAHYKLKRQIIASAESIPALIAEGFAKRSSIKELKRYLKIALGSSDETISHARTVYILAKSVNTIDKELCIKVGKEYKIVSKQINKLIQNWIDYSSMR